MEQQDTARINIVFNISVSNSYVCFDKLIYTDYVYDLILFIDISKIFA